MTTASTRCLYALRPNDRPDCQLTATVAYGPTVLCSSCDQQRSTLGKGHARRKSSGTSTDPLDLLTDARTHLAAATERLTTAVTRARQHNTT